MSDFSYTKTSEEIELIRKNCLITSSALARVAEVLRPGMTSLELDLIAEETIRDLGASPAFKGYEGFPGTLCISPNDVVVHGIPGAYEFKEGDIISIDCGAVSEGYYGDSAYTFAIGEISEEVRLLLVRTRESLYKGIEQAYAGNRVGNIGYAVQNYTEKQFNYGVVRELVGHGVGKDLHEDPQIPNYGRKGQGKKLREGLVIAIEPMVTLGSRRITQDSDGWTIRTRDGLASAHFEHTVVVRKKQAEILTTHVEVEENIKKNANLLEI